MTKSVREREGTIAQKIEPLIVAHLTEVLSASGGGIDAYGGIELVRSLRDQIASALSPDLSKAVEALKVFADDYAHMGYDNTNTDEQELDEGPSRLTVGDLRRARAAYNHLTRDKG